jgi:hypothetical protein
VLDTTSTGPPLVSERERLAELALAAALATPGVLGVAGEHATSSAAGPLRGVVAAAGAAERYDIDLFLRADLVPLHALAELVRTRVRSAAERSGARERIGTLGISFLEIGPAPPSAP